ncbi:VOC family protein [Pseudonocardia acaciae]|uniref:VOC family protein n=1 Tax=Pseudonocardia acaciae TaxID=551276 RepID=UPI00048EB3F7|nr:VOC family protein [Pseudonocardia acaciae]
MSEGIRTVIVPVADLAKAKAVYGELAGAPAQDEPYYVGYDLGGGLHVGLDPNGHGKGMTGPVGYWHVEDIEASLEALLAAGAQTVSAVRNVGTGRRIATVRDTDGNLIGLLQP